MCKLQHLFILASEWIESMDGWIIEEQKLNVQFQLPLYCIMDEVEEKQKILQKNLLNWFGLKYLLKWIIFF